eukprot:TRINITY_DN332_c0_g1_i1.p1 TRINITY_DN332_c0_g1~~TRINITY_DN332_c0_g1_i1.p1  ORF type:complete len:427 (-),score=76.32 TRINITY_DN332_c0_g1_i1:87-1325(-)
MFLPQEVSFEEELSINDDRSMISTSNECETVDELDNGENLITGVQYTFGGFVPAVGVIPAPISTHDGVYDHHHDNPNMIPNNLSSPPSEYFNSPNDYPSITTQYETNFDNDLWDDDNKKCNLEFIPSQNDDYHYNNTVKLEPCSPPQNNQRNNLHSNDYECSLINQESNVELVPSSLNIDTMLEQNYIQMPESRPIENQPQIQQNLPVQLSPMQTLASEPIQNQPPIQQNQMLIPVSEPIQQSQQLPSIQQNQMQMLPSEPIHHNQPSIQQKMRMLPSELIQNQPPIQQNQMLIPVSEPIQQSQQLPSIQQNQMQMLPSEPIHHNQPSIQQKMRMLPSELIQNQPPIQQMRTPASASESMKAIPPINRRSNNSYHSQQSKETKSSNTIRSSLMGPKKRKRKKVSKLAPGPGF